MSQKELIEKVLSIGEIIDEVFKTFPTYDVCLNAHEKYNDSLTQKQEYWVSRAWADYLKTSEI